MLSYSTEWYQTVDLENHQQYNRPGRQFAFERPVYSLTVPFCNRNCNHLLSIVRFPEGDLMLL